MTRRPSLARENPFATGRVLAIRYRIPGGLEPWIERLEALGWRAAIVGPKGSGKTTLLEDLGRALEARGFRTALERLSAEEPELSRDLLERLAESARAGAIVLLDGADELTPRAWRGFLKACGRGARILVTAHRPGRLPSLIRCRTSPELLAEIAGDLLGRRDADGPLGTLAATLYQKHAGDIRAALRELYDIWADRAPPP